VGFRFQVPKSAESTASFRMGTLPRVAELRVIAEASSQMRLEVEGFEPPQPSASPQGKRVLVTRRMFQRGNEAMDGFSITLSGLPVPSSGRWVAVLIALGFAAVGFASARGVLRIDGGDDAADSSDDDLAHARDLLLDELVEVERARQRGDLGPRAYREARQTLLSSLARLEQKALSQPTTAPSRGEQSAA
jgi:hypothetical protein